VEGNSSTQWHTATNWSQDVVPTSYQYVIIPSGSNCVIPNGSTGEYGQIEIEELVDLDVLGELAISGL